MGDRQALIGSGRRVIRFHFRKDLLGELERMAFEIKEELP
jgi:hypothetical protein